MNLHLTHDQLCDLILSDESPQPNAESNVVEQHLQACLICSAELKSLRDSISHFRDASSAFARHEFAHSYVQRSSISPPHSYLSQPLYWAAAAVIFVAALFPITMHHSAADSAAKAAAVSSQTESDEALLADIDQKVSAEVPSSMEPLANPTDGTTSTTSTSDQRTN